MKPTLTVTLSAIFRIFLIFFPTSNFAQSIHQHFNLRPGWNTIYTEIEPENTAVDEVFLGIPIESVWTFSSRFSATDFIEDPSEPEWNRALWLAHFPPEREESITNNLFHIHDNRGYLINIADELSRNGLRFDGVDDLLRISDFVSVAPTHEITIEFWHKISSASENLTFFTDPDDSTNRISAHLPWSDGIIYWDFGDSTGNGRLSYSPVTSIFDTWQHWAFVASSNGNFMKLYQNGVEVAHKDGMTPLTQFAGDLLFGQGNGATIDIAELRIWAIARGEADIRSTLHTRLNGDEDGLMVYYRFDEQSGAATTNAVGGGTSNNGILSGEPIWTTTGIESIPFTISGRPSYRRISWTPNAYNLRGLPVDPANPPTFADYFRPSRAHYNTESDAIQEIYRLNSSGHWQLIDGDDVVQNGVAYWIFARGASTFMSPLDVELIQDERLDYGAVLTELSVRFQNLTDAGKTVSIADVVDPAANPMSWFAFDPVTGEEWHDLVSPHSFTVEPGNESILRLAIRRSAFAGELYQTILEITDGEGGRFLVSVNAEKTAAGSSRRSDIQSPYVGLWVGTITLNQVNEVNALSTREATGGAAVDYSRTIFAFDDVNNDIEIRAKSTGPELDGLTVTLLPNTSLGTGVVVATYDNATSTLTAEFNGVTTVAQSVIDAVNGVADNGFTDNYEAVSGNGEGPNGVVLLLNTRTQVTSGGAAVAASAVFPFTGEDNDVMVRARSAGPDLNGLRVNFLQDPTLPGDTAAVKYVLSDNNLTIRINNGVTTAQTVIDAINSINDPNFLDDEYLAENYEAASANGEAGGGAIALSGPLTPTQSEMNLRLLVHVDNDGQARLLKEVIQMFDPAVFETDAEGRRIEVEQELEVLLTNDRLIPQFQGGGLRDGKPVGRRLSSAAFDFSEPDNNALLMTGNFGDDNLLNATISLEPNFPTHPFRHKFHPDHDNLDPAYQTFREEAYEITRQIELRFSSTPPSPGPPNFDHGYLVATGTYYEEIDGLHKDTLTVQGPFTLNRVSSVGALNPEPRGQ